MAAKKSRSDVLIWVMLALFFVAMLATTHTTAGRIGAGAFIAALTLFWYFISRTYDRQVAARALSVKEEVEALAKTLFDVPAAVETDYDPSVAAPANAQPKADSPTGCTTSGTCDGVKVSTGSRAYLLADQPGMVFRAESYVCVDLQGLDVWFYLVEQGAKSAGPYETTIGDARFDEAWAIFAQPHVARAVLDESIRERLGELRARARQLGVNENLEKLSVFASPRGLALRWPDTLDEEHATFIRDLLLDMRKNILHHADALAAQTGAAANAGGGYRVAAHPEEAAAEDVADDDAEKRARV